MIKIGAELMRIEPHLKGQLRVYKLGFNYWVTYTSEKRQETHQIDDSPYRAKALELLKKRVTICAPDDTKRPCH